MIATMASGVAGLPSAAGTATAQVPESPPVQASRRFEAPEAQQAVTVSERHFYAIGNRVIAKYDKQGRAAPGQATALIVT